MLSSRIPQLRRADKARAKNEKKKKSAHGSEKERLKDKSIVNDKSINTIAATIPMSNNNQAATLQDLIMHFKYAVDARTSLKDEIRRNQ